MDLRAEFPICSRLAYLNAGTDGPVPAAAAAAAARALESQVAEGRHHPHIDARMEGQDALRSAYAGLLGCAPGDLALTTSTSEGLGKVIAGLELGRGDEILTAEGEHPGLIGPLLAARERGVRIRTAPLARIAAAVEPATALVACSHVAWFTGEIVDPALAEVDVPVLLDGAQAAGAVAVDVSALGCAAYAASGQKWLCGADGTGLLYLAAGFRDRVRALGAGYTAFEKTDLGLDSPLRTDARRHDTVSLPREGVAFSLAAFEVLAAAGWDAIHARATALAERLSDALRRRGRAIAPRGATTLVSFEDPDPPGTTARLRDAGVVVRELPGTSYVRASVGAWNDEDDLERLLSAL